MSITVEQKKTIIELYSAYFNRAADSDGAKFWSNSFEVYFKNAPETFSKIERLFRLAKNDNIGFSPFFFDSKY